MKILAVDDSRTIRRLVKKYLGGFPNLEIEEAENGKEGLEKAFSEDYDLIILDVTMPVMDGTQMLEKLRENEKTKSTRVLMLTAESRKDLVLNMIQLGISDYIVKPFVQEVFVHKVGKIIGLDPASAGTGNPADEGMPRVLVVDDRANVLTAAKRYLSEMADVLTTPNPYEAVEMATRRNPEVIILDLVMPDTSTFEIFSMMRASPSTKDARFVAMGIRTMRDEVERAHRAGFNDLLLKPFDRNQIIRVVRRNLRGHRNLITYDGDIVALRLGSFVDAGHATRVFIDDAIRVATDAMREAADSGFSQIIIDMSGADEGTDMSIISAIQGIQKNGVDLGVSLCLVAPEGGALGNVLRQPGTMAGIPVFTSLEDAAQSMKGR